MAAPPPRPSAAAVAPTERDPGRAPFGLPALDALLEGGLVRGTTTLLAGSLGTGKTLLGLRFALAGVEAGEPSVFLGLREAPDQLGLKARVFGGGDALRRATAPGGGLEVHYRPPVDLDPDRVADHLLATLERTGARRLVLDSVAELERAVRRHGDPGRVDEYLAALTVATHRRGVTVLLLKETPLAVAGTFDYAADPLGMVVDNVLLLQQLADGSRLRRVLSVVKTRFSAHDAALHEFVIGPPQGLRVAPRFPDTQGTSAPADTENPEEAP